jgi:hypothetical protein
LKWEIGLLLVGDKSGKTLETVKNDDERSKLDDNMTIRGALTRASRRWW